MALNRGALDNFYEARKPYLEEIIGMNFRERPMKFQEFLNMKTAKTGWVDVATVSGLGLFAQTDELDDYSEDQVIQGPVARATVLKYTKRFPVSEEAIEDDLGDGIIANRMPAMMRSARATQEVLGHAVLNNAFTVNTTPDGAYTISSAHVNLVGTSSLSNLITGDLTQAKLEEAILKIENMADDRNIPIFQVAQKLIINPANKWNAQVILGSAQKVGVTTVSSGDSVTGFNDINPMYASGLTTCESPYITDDDSWFLQADIHDLNWWTRIPVENWSKVNEVNGSVDIGARFRSATSAWDWRGIVGSRGS